MMTSPKNNRFFQSRGFTLIEVMIAVTLSLILLAGVVQMFIGTKQTYNTAESLGRMQENARYVMDAMGVEIRQAGFLPCLISPNNTANVLNGNNTEYDFFGSPISAFEGDGVDVFDAAFPAVGTAPGDRVAGSDGIRILRGGADNFSIESHNPPSAQFKLKTNHTLTPGTVVLVCDATHAAILQITNSNLANQTIVHNTGTEVPGNCTKGLGTPVPNPCTANGSPYAFPPGSQLVTFQSTIFYLGISSSGTTNSIYSQVLGGPVLELVEDVETFQLMYGEAPSSMQAAERYVSADQVTDFNNVVSVRLGMLMRTPAEIAAVADTSTYNIIGTDVADTGTAVTYTSDRRQRYPFSTTIKIRNRGEGIGPTL